MITVLCGGVGAARFLRGLIHARPDAHVTAVVNVGDDLERLGLRICPDLDTITYWLGGVVHPDQQWGRADERHVVAEELRRLGHDDWFTLGDRDLAVHLHRTARLQQGATLTEATAEIAAAFGVTVRLLPVTHDPVETRVTTAETGEVHFQEYWVRDRAASPATDVRLAGAERAAPAPGVVDAILSADVVLIAPSNPVVSIGTVLAVPGVRAAVRATPAPVVGVSPIIGGRVVRGMADRLLPAVGAEVSASGVAALYAGLLDGWVIDEQDASQLAELRAGGLPTLATDTLMDDVETAARLVETCLGLAAEPERGRREAVTR